MSSSTRRATISNEEQLWLMSQVKQSIMTIDEAVSWTENRENELRSMEDEVITHKEKNGNSKKQVVFAAKKFKSFLHRKSPKPAIENKRKTSIPNDNGSESFVPSDLKNKQIYNFSVYRCGKHKTPQKRILQIDFDAKCLSLIHHGTIVKTYQFSAILSVNGQEGTKVFIHMDDSHELEINAENLADKTKLFRLLNIISEQNEQEERGQDFDPYDKLQQSFKVIKEGYLEKKGSYSANQWHKRLVIIRSGELAYYRVDEEELSAALNIIHLSPGSVAISEEDSATFTVATTKESHRFRLPDDSTSLTCPQKALRDEWIDAIREGCSRHYYKEQEAEYDNIDPSNETDNEEKDSFDVILQEIERLKNGCIGGVDENQKVQKQVEDFVLLMKELQNAEKQRVLQSGMKSNGNKNDAMTTTNKNIKLRKASQTNSSRSNSNPGLADIQEVKVRVESVYDIPASSLNNATVQENAYELAEESSAFMNEMRNSSRNDYDSSDDEKVTSFSWAMPPTSEKAPSQSISTSGDANAASFPPPPPNLCNGDFSQNETNNIVKSTNENDFAADVVTASEKDTKPISNHISNVGQSEPEVPLVPNGVVLLDKNQNKLCNNSALSLPPPVFPKPSIKTLPQKTLKSEKFLQSLLVLPPPKAENDEVTTPEKNFLQAENSFTLNSQSIPPPPPPLFISSSPNGVPTPPVGVPPPPAPIPLSPIGASKSSKGNGKVALRPFHWVPVPKQMISKSMWKNAPDLCGSIKMDELQDLFRSAGKKQDQTTETKSIQPSRMEIPKKKNYKSYLDQKTAQNLGIFLAGFKLRGDDLVKKLAIVNESSGGISTEYIVGLRKYAPEPELKSLYAKHAGKENEELAKEDRFLAELCRIPRLGLRLETLQIIRELPNVVETLKPEVDLVLNACYELLNSKKFEEFLQYMLAVANSVNATNSKGTTKGLRLSTLQKTNTMRTNDRKQTFLHVVIGIIRQSRPTVLNLNEELASVAKSQTYSIKGLLAEIDIMRKDCFKTKKNCEVMRRKKNQPTKEDIGFCVDIENELSRVEQMINRMGEKCVEIRQTLSKVLVKFGEAPDTDSQELFGWVRDFLEEFRKCAA